MREILFRGKRTDNGEWVEGYYVKSEKLDRSGYEHFIIEVGADGATYEVIPETVGQYTGLKDKNGRRIFEGDIVRRVVEGAEDMVAEIINISGAVFEIDFIGDETAISDFAHYDGTDFEVIGTIHDNPELLEADSKV